MVSDWYSVNAHLGEGLTGLRVASPAPGNWGIQHLQEDIASLRRELRELRSVVEWAQFREDMRRFRRNACLVTAGVFLINVAILTGYLERVLSPG